jgi:hypothetical protein
VVLYCFANVSWTCFTCLPIQTSGLIPPKWVKEQHIAWGVYLGIQTVFDIPCSCQMILQKKRGKKRGQWLF